MVASLQNKKEALEAKLRDKTSELRKLCIEEAELTGILPIETPLEPGESAPAFRRRIGTAYSFPENLINKLRSKEDETLAALELECKIQTGIADAAKGLASDGTAGKSVRRKHRLLYEDSQRRLLELEARLAAYRQAVPKQKKKPRPHTDFDNSTNEGGDVRDAARYPPPPVQLQDRNQNSSLRHSHTYGGLSKPDYNMGHQVQYRSIQSQMHIPVADYRYSLLEHSQHYAARSNNASPEDHNGTWSRAREININHHHSQLNNTFVYPSTTSVHDMNHHETASVVNFADRFGSLDRNSHYPDAVDSGERISATLPRNSTNPPSVLLPNQTYPESSLMRTQSLGNMDNLKHLSDRKKECKEKEWYETSLDSSPPLPTSEFPANGKTSDGQLSSPSNASVDMPIENGMGRSNQASINCIQFDTVVPYESPKNHTVVQAGKWQPYREVSKPFEMSDFYKYSTKYRQQSRVLSVPGHQLPPQVQETLSQQKGVYKAPMMHECQPLSRESPSSAPQSPNKNEYHYQHQLVDHGAGTWYRNKGVPKPRSSTLV